MDVNAAGVEQLILTAKVTCVRLQIPSNEEELAIHEWLQCKSLICTMKKY